MCRLRLLSRSPRAPVKGSLQISQHVVSVEASERLDGEGDKGDGESVGLSHGGVIWVDGGPCTL